MNAPRTHELAQRYRDLGRGVLPQIQLSDQEMAVRHSYQVIETAVRTYLAETGQSL